MWRFISHSLSASIAFDWSVVFFRVFVVVPMFRIQSILIWQNGIVGYSNLNTRKKQPKLITFQNRINLFAANNNIARHKMSILWEFLAMAWTIWNKFMVIVTSNNQLSFTLAIYVSLSLATMRLFLSIRLKIATFTSTCSLHSRNMTKDLLGPLTIWLICFSFQSFIDTQYGIAWKLERIHRSKRQFTCVTIKIDIKAINPKIKQQQQNHKIPLNARKLLWQATWWKETETRAWIKSVNQLIIMMTYHNNKTIWPIHRYTINIMLPHHPLC